MKQDYLLAKKNLVSLMNKYDKAITIISMNKYSNNISQAEVSKAQRFISIIDEQINNLSNEQRAIIILYFQKHCTNLSVYHKLHMSARTYHRRKREAVVRLANNLKFLL